MQTWIKANIGKLIDRITKTETAIGMPYNAHQNLSIRVHNLEMAGGYSDDYTQKEKAVGKWVDGKTIYKYTTHPGDLPRGSSTLYTPGGGFKIGTLIKAEIICSYQDNIYNLQYCNNVGNSRKLAQVYYDAINNVAVTDFDNTVAYKDVYVTYWYTKVRDE